MSIRSALAILVALAAAYALGAQGRNDAKIETSPHAEAVQLVLKSQQKHIRAVEEDDWWHDVKERAWVVKRPFHPGNVDSTHLFDVSYRVAGREVAIWLVDTRKGTVQSVMPKAKKL